MLVNLTEYHINTHTHTQNRYRNSSKKQKQTKLGINPPHKKGQDTNLEAGGEKK